MPSLREEIAKAWWELDASTEAARKLMPTPEQHINLFGDKLKYLDAILTKVQEMVAAKKKANPYENSNAWERAAYNHACGDFLEELNEANTV